jgi:hypothetical protein
VRGADWIELKGVYDKRSSADGGRTWWSGFGLAGTKKVALHLDD